MASYTINKFTYGGNTYVLKDDTSGYTTNTGTVTSVTTGAGLNTTSSSTSTDGGSITSSGTLYLSTSGVTDGYYGADDDISVAIGDTINVPYVSVDVYGRVVDAHTYSVTLTASALIIAETSGDIGVSVDSDTFISEVSDYGTYTFTYDGTNWTLNSSTVTLSDYGLTISDTPSSGDTVTVVYNTTNNIIVDNALAISQLEAVTDSNSAAITSIQDTLDNLSVPNVSTIEDNVEDLQDIVGTNYITNTDYLSDMGSLDSRVSTLESTATTLENRTESLEDIVDALNVDTTNATVTIVGDASSGTSIEVSDTITFTQDGQEVAVIDDQTFTINKTAIVQNLQFGDWAYIPRSNSHLTLKWIG